MRKTILIIVIISFFLLSGCNSTDSKYEKDLYSVFNVPLDSSIESIIEFESSSYNHTEYNVYTDRRGLINIEFAPYIDIEDNETCYKHRYSFDPDTHKIKEIAFRDILVLKTNGNNSNLCNHIDNLIKKVMTISSVWDEEDRPKFTMYGKIDDIKCKIVYWEPHQIFLYIEE